MVRIHDRELRLPGVPSNRLGAVQPTAVIVLAAGLGTRMRSATPKVLHPIAGRTLLGHVLQAAKPLEAATYAVVVGHGRDEVSAEAAAHIPGVATIVQDQQRGTGHAVSVALAALPQVTAGLVLVLAGDTPLVRTADLAGALAAAASGA